MLSPSVPLTSGTDDNSLFTSRRRNLPLISCRVCQVIPVAVEPLLTVKASSSLPTGRMTTPTTASVSTWSGCRWERRWSWTSLTWAWRVTAAAPLTMSRCVCVRSYATNVTVTQWLKSDYKNFSLCFHRLSVFTGSRRQNRVWPTDWEVLRQYPPGSHPLVLQLPVDPF